MLSTLEYQIIERPSGKEKTPSIINKGRDTSVVNRHG